MRPSSNRTSPEDTDAQKGDPAKASRGSVTGLPFEAWADVSAENLPSGYKLDETWVHPRRFTKHKLGDVLGKGRLAHWLKLDDEGQPETPATNSLVVRNNRIYAQLSIMFGIVLGIFTVYDSVVLFGYQRTSFALRWLPSLLVGNQAPSFTANPLCRAQLVHILSFFFFLLGFIYGSEAGDELTVMTSLWAGGINLVSFAGRITFQFLAVDFEPTVYNIF